MRAVWENIKSLAGAVLIYLVIKTFLMEAFRIPSGSMIPTLMVGDWLFVNKIAYGPHLPFTSSHLPGYHTPTHGDVVVFVSPYQADEAARGADPTPTLVKRLVGTPGDTLYMRTGMLYRNGIEQRQGFGASQRTGKACRMKRVRSMTGSTRMSSRRRASAPRRRSRRTTTGGRSSFPPTSIS